DWSADVCSPDLTPHRPRDPPLLARSRPRDQVRLRTDGAGPAASPCTRVRKRTRAPQNNPPTVQRRPSHGPPDPTPPVRDPTALIRRSTGVRRISGCACAGGSRRTGRPPSPAVWRVVPLRTLGV